MATLAEYEEDVLADTLDNEKRLFRAEARVSLKDANMKKGANRRTFLECHGQILCHYYVGTGEPAQATCGALLTRACSACHTIAGA